MRFQTLVLASAGLALQILNVVAQGNIVVPDCIVDVLQWTFNREGQSPCRVAATLQGLCFNNQWRMPPLAPGSQYVGPSSNQSNACQCSTVVFSLTAACGACQGAGIQSWDTWRSNCLEQDEAISRFPLEIPPNTGVPAWAYLDVTATGNIWDQDAARNMANSGALESAGGFLPSTIAIERPKSTVTHGASTARKSPPKAGVIVGGVVGGLIILAAIAFASFILYRRSYRPKDRPRHVYEPMDIMGSPSPILEHATRLFNHVWYPSGDPPKLYNPSDPYAFPLASVTPQGSPVSSQLHLGYKGVPEV